MKKIIFVFIAILGSAGAALSGTVVLTLSDYASGNTAVYNLDNGAFKDNVLPHYQDAYARTDGTHLYILEGMGADAVSKYSPDAIAPGKELYQYSVGENANPHDIVFCSGKAYIMLWNKSKILVIDPDAANEASFKKGEIDIFSFADADGYPEAHMGFVYGGFVYAVLQMYNLNTFSSGTAVLIKIDPQTDTIVDMDEAAEGIQGINLIIKNPISGSLLNGKLYLGGTTYGASEEGVMVIDLANYEQSKILSEGGVGGFIAGTDVFSGGLALVYSYDEKWSKIALFYDPATGVLGKKLAVPDAFGGVIMASDGFFYVGSNNRDNPGMYKVDPVKNEIVGDIFPTELPPYSMIYISGNTITVAVETELTPEMFVLDSVYPNPFNPSTTVTVHLSKPSCIRVEVFNSAGQKVDTLADSYFSAGTTSFMWNASERATGLYHVRVTDGERAQTVKALLMK